MLINSRRFPGSELARTVVAILLPALGALAAPAPPRPAATGAAAATADMNHAVDLLRQGKLNDADAAFQKTLAIAPTDFDASLGRAQIAIDQRNLEKADQMVSSVLASNNNLPEAHNMKGVVLLLRGDQVSARREFQRAEQIKPDYITPHLYLAVMARRAGQYEQAQAEYRALTQVAPHYPPGYLGQAEALTMQHREAAALAVLESWKAADPASLLPYQVIARINLSDGKPQDAIHQLQAAVDKNPHDAATLVIFGDAYLAAGDQRFAATQYQSALAWDHNNLDAALKLGMLASTSNQPDQALHYFGQVLAIDPKNAVAANDSAWLLASQGKDLDHAQMLAETAVRSAPKYSDAYDTLGWIQYMRGQYGAAAITLKNAQTLSPSSADVAAHLGLTYAKLNRRSEAVAELVRALRPGSNVSNRPQIESALAQLQHSSH